MAEHRFTRDERLDQLDRLATALGALLELLPAVAEYADRAPEYRAALARCEELRRDGFSAAALAELGRSVPDLWYRHKEWELPAERDAEGRLCVQPQLAELEERLRAVLRAAEQLRTLGWY